MENIEMTVDIGETCVSGNCALTGAFLCTLLPVPTYMDVPFTKQPEETKLSSLKIRV